jgi:hypothetical protein
MVPNTEDNAKQEPAAAEDKPVASKEPEKQPEVAIDGNLMKDVIDELGLDIDKSALDDIMNEAQKDQDGDKDKDKDMKEDDKK